MHPCLWVFSYSNTAFSCFPVATVLQEYFAILVFLQEGVLSLVRKYKSCRIVSTAFTDAIRIIATSQLIEWFHMCMHNASTSGPQWHVATIELNWEAFNNTILRKTKNLTRNKNFNIDPTFSENFVPSLDNFPKNWSQNKFFTETFPWPHNRYNTNALT